MRSIDFFDRGYDLNPEKAAIIDADRSFSFAEVRDKTRQMAQALRELGHVRQTPLALYSPNNADVLLALLCVWRAEAIWINVNMRNSVSTNAEYLNYIECEWMMFHSSQLDDIKQFQAQVPGMTNFICLDRNDLGYPCMYDLMEQYEPEGWKDEDADPFGNPQDVSGIFATGGTTGPAKGVNVTNMGWSTMLNMIHNYWGGRTDDPVCLTIAPITHAAGPVSLGTLGLGATQVVLPGFDAEKVLQSVEKYKVTHMYLPPTAMYMLLDHPDVKKYDVSSMKIFLLVGSPCAPDKLRQAVEIFGPCMCQCYGQVESPMITTWFPPEEIAWAARNKPELLASCGKPSYPVRIGILDDDGRELPVGEAGEICVRGILVSRDYHKKPEATAEVRTFGWHHTGDIGRRDEQGYIYIVDRKKDMIITGGFNVFTTEVEGCIMEMPEVLECAIIGIPDEKWGEAITAIVVKAEGADISEDDVKAYAKSRIGSVKSPKSVYFRDSIPKTPNNKTDKKALKAPFWGEASRGVN